METPDRAMLLGKPPPASLWDSPTFTFMNNLSPILPMEAIDSPDIARMFRMTHTKPHSIQGSEKRRRILFAAEAETQENVISIYSAMKPEAHEGDCEKARDNIELTGGSIDPFTSAMPIVEGKNLTKSVSLRNQVIEECQIIEVECQIIDCDAQKDSTIRIIEESSQDSPKKNRLKTENGAESDGCKRCKCKKSKCLKLYCECFAAGLYCMGPCSCEGCFNKPIHKDIIHSARKKIEARNPLAFATKLIQDHQVSCLEGDDHMTPASAPHRQGCNCKKSSCSKKYCECYQAGVRCSIYCRCAECKNSFGRRDGFKEIEIKASPEVGSGRQMINSQIGHHSSENALPIEPLQSNRPDGMFSSAMAPQSTWLSVGGLPGFYAPNMFWKPEMVLPQLISDNNFTTIGEVHGISAILRPTPPSTTGVKTVSPNRKRVHPLHNDSGLMPPTCKSFRKLP